MAHQREYNTKEAAELFGCTEGRICQVCRWNEIGSKWGKAWRLTASDLKKISRALSYKGKNLTKSA